METTPGVVIFNLKTCSAEETDDEDVLDLHVGGTMSEPLVKPHPTQSSTWANFRRRLSSIPWVPEIHIFSCFIIRKRDKYMALFYYIEWVYGFA